MLQTIHQNPHLCYLIMFAKLLLWIIFHKATFVISKALALLFLPSERKKKKTKHNQTKPRKKKELWPFQSVVAPLLSPAAFVFPGMEKLNLGSYLSKSGCEKKAACLSCPSPGQWHCHSFVHLTVQQRNVLAIYKNPRTANNPHGHRGGGEVGGTAPIPKTMGLQWRG